MSTTILVADDLATQRAALSYALNGFGYTTLTVGDGEEAWKKLNDPAAGIDLVITDLRMPRMDGLSLLERIKQDGHLQGLPVLMTLMESQLNQREALRQAGAVGWLLKPFRPEQLGAVVGKIIPK